MFEQYVTLFRLDWIEPWMVEALGIMLGAMLLMMIVCKAIDCMNGDK
jgi:hypothetical protein